MKRVCAFIIAGYISFTGFTVQAQLSTGSEALMDRTIEALTGASSTEISSATIINTVVADVMNTTESTGPIVSSIQGALSVNTPVPEANKTPVDIVDTKTKRYIPRMKIDFAEFNLSSLMSASRSNNGRRGETKTRADIVVERIQIRLRAPQIELAVQDRTATISGTVETERQRSLAESMLLFEPGIDVVKNEIVVKP